METEEPDLFCKWIDQWKDLIEFEVIPVLYSEEATNTILNLG